MKRVVMAVADKGAHIDRRVLRSRKAIVDAFDRLLEDHEFSQITVSAIAREANIDRKTFYVHFGTIDGLIDAIAEERVDELLDVMEDAFRDASKDEEITLALQTFFEIANRIVCTKLVQNCLSRNSIPPEDLLMRVLGPLKRKLIERGLVVSLLPHDQIDYYLSFIMAGILSIYRAWLKSDRTTPIEEVSSIANDLILSGLSSIGGRIAASGTGCGD